VTSIEFIVQIARANVPYFIIAAVVLLLIICCVLILPFILLSTNRHLRRFLREQEKTNALLESMNRPRESNETPEPLPRVHLEPDSRLDSKRKSRT
jgi:hypothetical protein